MSWCRSLVREAWGTLLPGALAVGLFLLLPRDSRSQTAPARPSPASPPATLCGAWHRGSGETVPLDLARVKRAYEGLKARVTRAVDQENVAPPVDLRKPYGADLPACQGDATRTAKVPLERGTRVRGRAFYFASVGDPARVVLPPEVERDLSVQVLILRTRSLGDLPELAKRFGRPMNLAGTEFAKAVGVRCANTWVKFSENGDEVEIVESR